MHFGGVDSDETESMPNIDDYDDDELDDSLLNEVEEILDLLDKKLDKDNAKYTDSSTTQEHCSDCMMFISPDKCDLVDGNISPEGWCTHYEKSEDS